MTNKEMMVKKIQQEDAISAAYYILSRIICSKIFPELSERFAAKGYEVKEFAEYLEEKNI